MGKKGGTMAANWGWTKLAWREEVDEVAQKHSTNYFMQFILGFVNLIR